MLDVESQEGIIKAAVKPAVHSFMGTGKFSECQPREEETDEPNDPSDEEEELCPSLEETMAASWIAQIGEEELSETEAVDSFIAMNEQRKRTWAQAQELKKAARKDPRILLITYSGAKSSEWFPTAATVKHVDLQIPWTETEHRKIFVLDCARKTGVFAARRRVTGRLNVQRNNTNCLPPSSQD